MNLWVGIDSFADEEGWENLDIGPLLDHSSVQLEYENDTFSLIYSPYTLAYFDDRVAQQVLIEWYRVLKPGGILRISLPDFQTLAILCADRGISMSTIYTYITGRCSDSEGVVRHFRGAYNFDKIHHMLLELDLRRLRRYNWEETTHAHMVDHSQSYVPEHGGVLVSLNLEGMKSKG